MSRRRNYGHAKLCSLVSRLCDRESGTKKLNEYAMTWDISSNIEYNVVHILKFYFEGLCSRPGSHCSCISDQHRTFDRWPQALGQWIMETKNEKKERKQTNIESSIFAPYLQVVERAGLTAYFFISTRSASIPSSPVLFPCGSARHPAESVKLK